MNLDDYYQVGHVAKLHGLSGDIVLHLDVSSPAYYANLDVLLLEDKGELIPYFIDTISISGNKARIALSEISTRDEAQPLLGSAVYLPIKYLPPLEGEEYYFHELIGYELIYNDQVIGHLEKIYDLGAQDLFSFTYEGQEVLVPLHKDILKVVDQEKKQILLDLPEGLLDIYRTS